MSSTDAAVRRRASGFAAFANVVWTLVMSSAVFVAFLIAPLVVLALAFLVYWMWPGSPSRSRSASPTDELETSEAGGDRPAYRFGTGG
jgi:hypothetical protein